MIKKTAYFLMLIIMIFSIFINFTNKSTATPQKATFYDDFPTVPDFSNAIGYDAFSKIKIPQNDIPLPSHRSPTRPKDSLIEYLYKINFEEFSGDVLLKKYSDILIQSGLKAIPTENKSTTYEKWQNDQLISREEHLYQIVFIEPKEGLKVIAQVVRNITYFTNRAAHVSKPYITINILKTT